MSVTVTEAVSVVVVSTISVVDTVAVSEAITLRVPFYHVSVYDSSSLTESIGRTLVCNIKPTTTTGIQLWSKLNSASDVTSPQLGTGGAEVGSPTYIASKFGNGILSDVDDEGCTFPTAGNNINLDKGTIEFWAKMNYAPDQAENHRMFSFCDWSNGGILMSFMMGTDDFRVQVLQGGEWVVIINTVGMSWNVGDLLHFALTWDRTGSDIGGGKTLVLKVNDVEEASSVATWATDTVNANLYIGIEIDGAPHSDAVIDNIKTFNICKTNFSDKEIEETASGPVETVSVAESIVSRAISYLSVYDAASVTDVDAVQLLTLFNMIVYDSASVTESIGIDPLQLKPSVYDSVSIAELISTLEALPGIDVSDSISVAEYIKAMRVFLISKYESVTVAEAITILRTMPGISVSDAVALAEKIVGNMWKERTKETDAWTERTKETDSWTERTKETDTWTERPHKEGA